MKLPSWWSVRTSLLLLVLLSLVPSRGLGIYTSWEMRQAAREEALGDAMRLARATSTAGERLVEGTRQILTILVRLPEVRTMDPAACQAVFADLLKAYPQVSNLGVAARSGDVFCSAIPFDGVASVADRSYFQRAVDLKDFAHGEYRIGRITGKAVINFAYPVMDAAGNVKAVAFAGLDLSWLSRLLAESRLPENSTITAVDDAGQVLARYPDPERWVGRSFPDAAFVRAAIARHGEGTVEGRGLDGAQRLYAFTPLRAGGQEEIAHVYVGIPSDSAFARVNQIANEALVGFGVVLGMALLVAGIGSRMLILHPLNTLLETMRRLGSGDLAARTGLPHTGSEVGRLAAALDEMADRLEVRRR
jgi:HAMP domain-containing protein